MVKQMEKIISAGLEAGERDAVAFNAAKRVPLLEYFPVACGSPKTEIQLELQLMGLRLVNEAGHVVMLCHLHDALKIVTPNAPTWPDMELLIRNHGPSKVFVGNRPETLEDARKRFHLVLGMSATSFAKDSKGGRFLGALTKQRQLKPSSLVQNLVDRMKGQETRKIDEAAYELQKLLHNKEYERGRKRTCTQSRLRDVHRSTPPTASWFRPCRDCLMLSLQKCRPWRLTISPFNDSALRCSFT